MSDPLAQLALQLLGPTTIATAVSAWIRQWVKSKLKVFEKLVAQARYDRQWRGLASARIRSLEDQLEVNRRNNHQLRNYVQHLSLCLGELASVSNIKLELPRAVTYEVPRTLTGDDLLKLLEADAKTLELGPAGPEESAT